VAASERLTVPGARSACYRDAVSDGAADFDLLAAWQAGDRAAGDQLFSRHFSALFRFFRNKVDDALAEDLTQVTFLACVDGRDRFRGSASFRTYLFAIARNQLLMHFRKKGTRDKVVELGTHSVADLGASPATVANAKAEQKLLLQALRQIPVDFQIAIELYYWEGMSTKELAEVLDIPEGTVRSRLTRAREHLAKHIERLAGSPAVQHSTIGGLESWARSLQKLLGE
jgi:RNA polymerase sigma-70 factor (ECF subfamily)